MTDVPTKAQLAHIKPGDHVMLCGWPPVAFLVTDATSPSLLTLRGPSGGEFKVDHRVVSVVTPQPEEQTR